MSTSRRAVSMTPRTLDQSDDVKGALRSLERFAKVLYPEDEDGGPILAPTVRNALLTWMRELDHAEKLKEVKLKPRRTALLYGPPGTGKTTWAHTFAARRGLPLVAVQSENLLSKYVNQTGEQMGALFGILDRIPDKCVVLFDEIDAIAPHRGHEQSADKERASYLTVMLRRFEQYQGIALAATNRKDAIDSALWRRFDMQIEMEFPGEEERFAIIRRYAEPFEFSDEETDALVSLTYDASPSLIRQLIEGAKREIVLGPVLGYKVGSAADVFTRVAASIAPPPELVEQREGAPPLWANKIDIAMVLADFQWPPKRNGA